MRNLQRTEENECNWDLRIQEKMQRRGHGVDGEAFEYNKKVVREEYGVHKLTTYAYELALAFSSFYHDVRVVKDDNTYNGGAAELAEKAQETLAQVLHLLGISAPTKM